MIFTPGFFDRADGSPDARFYAAARFVTHIDDDAIQAVGALYEELAISGDVLDLMASWVSHFRRAPEFLTVLGMNRRELEANRQARRVVVQDLNRDPLLPFPDRAFDAVVCCVSVDYLTAPVEVFRQVGRVLRPGGPFVCTFSNRLFPTKAIRGWLEADDWERCRIVTRYFDASGGWADTRVRRCTPPDHPGDPLYAVWARAAGPFVTGRPSPARPG